jgi:hypothetical protein
MLFYWVNRIGISVKVKNYTLYLRNLIPKDVVPKGSPKYRKYARINRKLSNESGLAV